MNNSIDQQPVAFLDTNALHYIDIFMPYAEELESSENPSRIHELECEYGRNYREALMRGKSIAQFISERDLWVEYSPISELELLTGRTRGAAIISMAKEQVPPRMWTRLRERDIRARVSSEEMANIEASVKKLEENLDKLKVRVIGRTSPEKTRDALEFALEIVGLVYIESVDSIIYASALLADAQHLVTSDSQFRKVINGIKNSPSGRYPEIREKLQDRARTFLGRSEVNFPEAPGMKNKQ